MAAEEDVQEWPPPDQVVEWRYVQLQALGFGEVDAELLAVDRAVDVHDVAKLVYGGCPLATAVEIVRS